MATLYCAEHVHTAQTQTRIPTPYFFVGPESESESIHESVSSNVNEPLECQSRTLQSNPASVVVLSGTNDEEKNRWEMNARNQVTMWGPSGQVLNVDTTHRFWCVLVWARAIPNNSEEHQLFFNLEDFTLIGELCLVDVNQHAEF